MKESSLQMSARVEQKVSEIEKYETELAEIVKDSGET